MINFLRKIPYFVTLTDYETVQELDSGYQRFLVHASFIRQIVAFIFSFSVLLYSISLIMSFWLSVFFSFLIALTLFFMDQAMIGSEWSLKKDISENRVINFVYNLFQIPIKFLVRLTIASFLAYSIATLAELALQRDAIDIVLKKETQDNNKQYDQKMSIKEKEINEQIKEYKAEILETRQKIQFKKNSLLPFNIIEGDSVELRKRFQELKMETFEIEQEKNIRTRNLNQLNAKLKSARTSLQNNEEQRKLEVDPNSGRIPKRGKRFNEYANTVHKLNKEIIALEREIQELNSLNDSDEKIINNNNIEITKINNFLSKDEGKSVAELTIILDDKTSKLDYLLNDKENILNKYSKHLDERGEYFKPEFGLLTRFIGLKKLHNDPEYGEAALNFSYGLKLVILLVEISPVVIVFLFSPFSFYRVEMQRRKREFLKSRIYKDYESEKEGWERENEHISNRWYYNSSKKIFEDADK